MNQQFYEFFIFDSKDKLIFYLNFNDLNENQFDDPQKSFDEEKVYKIENTIGIAKALKSFVQKLSPYDIINFNNYNSNYYKYSIYEIINGLKLVLLSQNDDKDYQELLENIYQSNYLESVNRNILYKKGDYINIPQFKKSVIQSFTNAFK